MRLLEWRTVLLAALCFDLCASRLSALSPDTITHLWPSQTNVAPPASTEAAVQRNRRGPVTPPRPSTNLRGHAPMQEPFASGQSLQGSSPPACLEMNGNHCTEGNAGLGLTYKVPQTLYKENRDKLCARLRQAGAPAKAVVVMEGGKEEYRHETDTEKIFRQESTFHYLFGVKEPSCYGTIDVHTGNATLYIPRLGEEYAVWMGFIQPPSYFKELYGVEEVLFVDELTSQLKSMAPSVLLLNQGLNTDSGSTAKPASFDGMEGFKTDLALLYPEVVECRVIKSAQEIQLLQFVNDISSDAHFEVMRQCRVGMFEYQLESLFLHRAYSQGGCRHASYTSICGCGPNAATLHYGHAGAPNDRVIGDGEMLLLDMGAEYCCYGSDITCSFPSSGVFTPDQRMIFEAVAAMQFAVIDALRPGVSWVDMHELAYRVGAQKLLEGGLLKGVLDEIMAANVMAIFMPHGLGHFMGIDVHDVGGYAGGLSRDAREGFKRLRTVRVMQAGMVITVEPGIYFIDCLLDKALADPLLCKHIDANVLARFRGSGGVRLEDDVVITDSGVHNFTNCARTVEDVEGVMSGRIKSRKELFKKG